MKRALVAAALLLLPPAQSAAVSIECGSSSAWQLVDRSDASGKGDLVYRCRPAHSDYDAYRLEAVIAAPPAVVAAAARAEMADPDSAPPRAEKKVLRDDGEDLVIYTYAHLPLVSDRDVTTRATLSFDARSGVRRLEWQATDQEGPPAKEGVVRVKDSSGAWTFTPLDGAATRVTYESHSDLAGSVPAWLINSLMIETVVDNLARLRTRVQRDRH